MGGRLPAPVIWVTHDRRYQAWEAHHSREAAEREQSREPKMIDVVEYVPKETKR